MKAIARWWAKRVAEKRRLRTLLNVTRRAGIVYRHRAAEDWRRA